MSIATIAASFDPLLPKCKLLPFSSFFDDKAHVLLDVFKRTVFDATLIVGLTCITATFTATSVGVNVLIVYAASTIAINLLCRLGNAYWKTQNEQNDPSFLSKFPALNSSLFFQATGGVLVHECGHALAANLLLKNGLIKIVWTSLFSGATYFSAQALSRMGSIIGLNASIFCIVLAGPLAGVVTGASAMAVGLGLRKSHPELSSYFKMIGIAAIVHHALYALSALSQPMDCLSHDFVMLWHFGIHPIAAAVAIIALPILIHDYSLSHSETDI